MSKSRLGSSTGNTASVFGALLLIALISVALAPVRALAQQQGAGGESGTGMVLPFGGWYSGLSVGRSQFGIRDSILPVTGATLSNLSRDESSTGYKLYGGYQFNQNFALEGGYADFGKFDARREITAPALDSMSSNIRASGF